MDGGGRAGGSGPHALWRDDDDGGDPTEDNDGGGGGATGSIQRGRGLVQEARRRVTTEAEMTRTVAALGLTRNEQAQGQAQKGFEEAARARARTTTAARRWTAETGADVVRLDDDEPGSEETRADDGQHPTCDDGQHPTSDGDDGDDSGAARKRQRGGDGGGSGRGRGGGDAEQPRKKKKRRGGPRSQGAMQRRAQGGR